MINRDRNNPFFRVLAGKPLFFSVDPESGGICAKDSEGFLITPDELERICQGIQEFIRYHGIKQIEDYNKDNQKDLERAEKK